MHKLLAVVLLSGSAFAATGVFSFSGTATGVLNGTPFTNAPFTVTAPGDFTTATCAGGICRLNIAAGAATFTIAGAGSGAFTGTTYFFDNQTATPSGTPAGIVGFGTTADLILMYGSQISSSALTTYNLQSNIGPLGPQATNPPPGVAAFMNATTTVGNLTVSSLTNFIFQVGPAAPAPPATPAPSSAVLIGIGLTALGIWKFRSQIFAS